MSSFAFNSGHPTCFGLVSHSHWWCDSASASSFRASKTSALLIVPASSTGAAFETSIQPALALASACWSTAATSLHSEGSCAHSIIRRNRRNAKASSPCPRRYSARNRSCTSDGTPCHSGSLGPASARVTFSSSTSTRQCRSSSPALFFRMSMLSCIEAALSLLFASSFGSGGSTRVRSSPRPPCRKALQSTDKGAHIPSSKTIVIGALSSSSTCCKPELPPTLIV
mmetsp:Transcript_11590/g.26216  ORF Transcript_11590/g.26216 Transcript_11590/m.26216 type:complete len:226 (-) Transcript_11590:62-739(-)